MALYSVVPMLPGLERTFGTAPGSTHLGISLPFLVLVLLSPLVPRLRLPVGVVIGGGLLGVGVFGILAGLAPTLEIWTQCRTLQGAFAAAIPGLSLALLPRLFPGRHLQMAGLWVAGNVLGGGLGRGLGGLFAEWFGERLALVLLALPVAVIAFWVLRERESLALPAPRYTLSAWPLYVLGFALLFVNFFVANLMPYRLEALGLSQARSGRFSSPTWPAFPAAPWRPPWSENGTRCGLFALPLGWRPWGCWFRSPASRFLSWWALWP